MGLALESFGLPPMAGRVLAALLVADPAEQTAEDLAKTLQASRGGISGAIQMLEAMGLIDRLRKRGDRRDYVRNKPDAWRQAMKKEIMALTNFRHLAERGLDILNSDDAEVNRGLSDMRDMLIFMEKELPSLFERWEKESGRIP